jgi:ATPase family protein associated with various cellular activities (AAA)/AAA+ lid domain-containing protein
MRLCYSRAMGPLRDLELTIQSRYPFVAVETSEEDRLEKALADIAADLRVPFFVWTVTSGLRRAGLMNAMYDTQQPLRALNTVAAMTGEAMFLTKDLHRYFGEPPVVRKLMDLAPEFKHDRRVIVFSGAKIELPAELSALTALHALELPGADELKRIVKQAVQTCQRDGPVKVELPPADLERLVERLRGFTAFEAERAVTRAILKNRSLGVRDIETIVEIKKELLKKDGVLEYIAPEENLAEVGGLANLKAWLEKRKKAFGPEAKQFGIEPPRGMLLLGVQGCGKSLVARAVAREWGLPLLKLEAARLYDKYVGETEKNLERALKTAEQMAPCVLMIDELEKALSYNPGGDADAGLSKRIFGRLLTWLNDRKAPVFVVATSNNISELPPELTRKGRFDEIFFVDLPNAADRAQIFTVHLKKRKRNPALFDLNALAETSDGFTGAEIEQAVVSALYTAFSKGMEVTSAIIAAELSATKPLSVTRAEDVTALRQWARDRAVMAS